MASSIFSKVEPTRYSIKPDERIDIKPIFRDKDGNVLDQLNFPLSWCIDVDDIGKLEMSDSDEFTGTFIPYGKAGTVRIAIYADIFSIDEDRVTYSEDDEEVITPLAVAEVTVTEDLGITTEITARIYSD